MIARLRYVAMAGVAASVLGMALSVPAVLPPAVADVEQLPVGEFAAPECAGDTLDDPAAAVTGDVADLTLVFGERLADYNARRLVILYDAAGSNDWSGTPPFESLAYPPLCVVRHVDGVGAVSEWMFCTDYLAHVCGGTLVDGRNAYYPGEPIEPLELLASNPRLDADQEKLIAWLVTNGHSYSGSGYFSFGGVSEAAPDRGTFERWALQTLVWCISDPVESPPSDPTEAERAMTCEASMNAAEQARLLAMIPDTPVANLELASLPGEVEVGESADFVLTTNLYHQPISLLVSGGAGTLVVVGSNAALVGTELVVDGTDPAVLTRVHLRITATSSGRLEITAAATPISRTSLSWSQSPTVSSDAGPCQVFAKFDTIAQQQLRAVASTDVSVVGQELAATGMSLAAPGVAGVVIAAGALVSAFARRRTRTT